MRCVGEAVLVISSSPAVLIQAAAAMCVGIGSFSDPYEAQGLAHFLGSLLSTHFSHLSFAFPLIKSLRDFGFAFLEGCVIQ